MLIKTFLSFLSIIFSFLMIYVTSLNFKKKILNQLEFLIWNILWLVIIFLSVRPKIIDNFFLTNFNIDIFYIVSILSIISLLIFCYFNMLKIKIIEKKINTIVRADALKKIIKKIKK
tara:strand:+ start:896 stop:1246 length:351 start_codon:yes stop_codon:yes gene_type:complete